MSFSSDTRLEAALLPIKKVCCRRMFIYGLLYCGADFDGESISLYVEGIEIAELSAKLILEQFGRAAEPLSLGSRDRYLLQFSSPVACALFEKREDTTRFFAPMKCEECRSAFIRGCFVGGGTVNSPDRAYHLEIKSRYGFPLSQIVELSAACGISFHTSERLRKPTIYLKSNAMISDLLFLIGAQRQGFAFVNEKIEHEIKNDINRRTNIETSNISKSVQAAGRHLAAIEYLSARGRLSELSPDLLQTAQFRMKYPDVSLSQLGKMMTPTVSKAGLFHRFEKILAYAASVGYQD
ncbi:MAG: DNA-binding protein WhiA [Clostridia bacterium]|nr:DNA-binding protein WhiA [Clostridia bacterium]